MELEVGLCKCTSAEVRSWKYDCRTQSEQWQSDLTNEIPAMKYNQEFKTRLMIGTINLAETNTQNRHALTKGFDFHPEYVEEPLKIETRCRVLV